MVNAAQDQFTMQEKRKKVYGERPVISTYMVKGRGTAVYDEHFTRSV